jgi:hypothetical protein
MDIGKEIREIGDLLVSAALMQEIRTQVAHVMREGFVVTDGCHHPLGLDYDVVVRCGSDRPDVVRRIRSTMPDMQIEKIAEGVLGIRTARRMRRLPKMHRLGPLPKMRRMTRM